VTFKKNKKKIPSQPVVNGMSFDAERLERELRHDLFFLDTFALLIRILCQEVLSKLRDLFFERLIFKRGRHSSSFDEIFWQHHSNVYCIHDSNRFLYFIFLPISMVEKDRKYKDSKLLFANIPS